MAPDGRVVTPGDDVLASFRTANGPSERTVTDTTGVVRWSVGIEVLIVDTVTVDAARDQIVLPRSGRNREQEAENTHVGKVEHRDVDL